jgi:hypothetical protein
MDMNNLQKEMNTAKPIMEMTKDEFNYSQKPIGKAIYKNAVGRPQIPDDKKAKPTDRIKCKICGKEYTRSHVTNHRKTQHHQTFAKVNKKLQELLID